ncbi:MAG: DUF4129 domain-containing protein [Chitinophagaceae bacterium]|nr:MAG: DUF4129 domain-containing protein [Chitinophagaceae bacterium]
MTTSLNVFTTNMLRSLLIIICMGFATLQPHAQVVGDTIVYDEEYTTDNVYNEEESYDTIIKIHAINIPADSIAYWKNKKEFAYMKNLDSLLKASQEEELNKRRTPVDAPNVSWLREMLNSGTLKVLLWMLAAIFVLAVLYNIFSSKGMFRARRSQVVEEKPEVAEADVLEQDLDSLLRKAEQDADYRLATRYGFLKILQQLKASGYIDFSPEKTNSMYVREVPVQCRNEFARTVLGYEYIWYGKAALTKEQYTQVQQQYLSLNQKM